MAYTTYDTLPDLSEMGRIRAYPLTLQRYSGPSPIWDNSVETGGFNVLPSSFQPAFGFSATAGAVYYIFSVSYIDPDLPKLYDSYGNVVAFDSGGIDEQWPGYGNRNYNVDSILGFTAPFSGTFYVEPNWKQGVVDRDYYLSIFEDVGTTTNIYGPGGSDQLWGSSYADTINGLAGNDTVIGLDGDDSVAGGLGDDDLNGNVGADIVNGQYGADTVRGGKDNDTIYGDLDDDPHVNGNLGNDQVYGGDGADTLFGGQDSDSLWGDAGADLLSGDLGNDILTGGPGADRFTIASNGGADWVADFNYAEGDRIQLAPGTSYSLTVVSNQVVIEVGAARLGLAGVASVSGDWLVFA